MKLPCGPLHFCNYLLDFSSTETCYIRYKGKIRDRGIYRRRKILLQESGNVCYLKQNKFFRLNPSLERAFAVLRRCVIQSCISVVNLYLVDFCFRWSFFLFSHFFCLFLEFLVYLYALSRKIGIFLWNLSIHSTSVLSKHVSFSSS